MKNLEYIGQWWIPSQENHTAFGLLTFSENNDFTLDLLGEFKEDNYDIIVGETNNQKISLFCCQKTYLSRTNSVTSPILKSYFIQYAFIGKIYEDKLDNLKFNKFKVSYTFLTEWMNNVSLDNIEIKNHQIEHNQLAKLSVNWNGYKITVIQNLKCPIHRNENVELRFTFTDYFEIETSGKTIYEVQEEVIKPLKHFLEIATNHHNLITSFEIIDDNRTVKIMGEQGLLQFQKYKYQPLICFKCHEEKIPQIITSWLDLEKKIGWLIDLYCSVKYYTGFI